MDSILAISIGLTSRRLFTHAVLGQVPGKSHYR
jgi:hypothetical protein